MPTSFGVQGRARDDMVRDGGLHEECTVSEWRTRVLSSPWRASKKTHPSGDVLFVLEAKVFSGDWVSFGRIDMDVAGEGWGDNVAEAICGRHNASLGDVL